MNVEEIKIKLLEQFPIGSKWYDCVQDTIVVVAVHFKPRGILCTDAYSTRKNEYIRYGFTDLLDERLVPPSDGRNRAKNLMDEYAKKSLAVDEAYRDFKKGKTVWS